MLRLLLAAFLLGLIPAKGEDLKVAVLHPLLGDIVRNVGGNSVKVVDLIGPKGDPHHFEPNTENLEQASGARLYLVAGMGLEGYLPKLHTIVQGKATIVEVGATLPALEGECEDHDHAGHHHTIDPHWWHSIALFSRATAVVTDALIAASPEHTEEFRNNSDAYRARLAELEKWTRKEIATIPRKNRHLATAHAAFNYFCKDYGFTPLPVQGLNREQMPGPVELAALVKSLRENNVIAIFPEQESNPKILQTLTADTGIKLGTPLIADGTGGKTYEEVYRHNVAAIASGLKP